MNNTSYRKKIRLLMPLVLNSPSSYSPLKKVKFLEARNSSWNRDVGIAVYDVKPLFPSIRSGREAGSNNCWPLATTQSVTMTTLTAAFSVEAHTYIRLIKRFMVCK